MRVALIVAAAENGVIGRDNALPWYLPHDLRYFKRMTLGKPIVMGRRTWESIGKPLPGRTNIVISRQAGYRAEGAHVVDSMAAALALAEQVALIDGAAELMVIGGAEIYRLALPLAERIYLTRVHAEVAGDARLPAIDWNAWERVSAETHGAEAPNPHDFSFEVYDRKLHD